jgi:hypothetical protein
MKLNWWVDRRMENAWTGGQMKEKAVLRIAG